MTTEIPAFQLSDETIIRPNDIIKTDPGESSGPVHRGKPVGVRGEFRVTRIYSETSGRIYLECVETGAKGSGSYNVLFVSGDVHNGITPGMVNHPYRIKRLAWPNE